MPRCSFPLSLFVASVLLSSRGSLTAQTPLASAPSATSASAVEEARRLIQTGHAELALQQLDALATSSPDTPGLQRSRGSAFYALDKLADADAAFARALQGNPRDQESAQMRGLTLYRLGRPAAAIPLLEGAHEAGAQSKADPTYVLALCYMDTRRYDDARHAFAAQYGMGPDSAPAYLLAARMLLRREYLPIALTFATRGVELDPKLPMAHGLLGEIALAQNRTDDAVKELEQERALNPLEGITYERLGDAYSRAARYPEAQKALQQAVLLEPNATRSL